MQTQAILFYVGTFGIEAMQFKTFDYSTCYSTNYFPEMSTKLQPHL